MACSSPGKSLLGELSPATNVLNFNLPVPAEATCDTRVDSPAKQQNNWEESKQESLEMPMKVDSLDEWKEESHGCSYVIDDNITPVHRPRAYDLDRSKTRRYRFKNVRWA